MSRSGKSDTAAMILARGRRQAHLALGFRVRVQMRFVLMLRIGVRVGVRMASSRS